MYTKRLMRTFFLSDDEEDLDPSPPDAASSSSDRSDYDDATRAAVEAADAARASYDGADREVRDLEDKMKALEKTLEQDYGADEEFASLRGECFETSDLEYTYKLCPFDYAEQRPKHGGSGTRLGSWDDWIVEGDVRTGMKYANGVTCWNGPAR